MIVKELIEKLQSLDQDKQIKIISWDGCGGYESSKSVFVNDYQKTKVDVCRDGTYSHSYYGIANYPQDEEFYYLSTQDDTNQEE